MLPNAAKQRRFIAVSEENSLILSVYWTEEHQQLNTQPAQIFIGHFYTSTKVLRQDSLETLPRHDRHKHW